MDAIDRKLLDALQAGIPLVERPYRALGEPLAISEREAIDRVSRLRADGLVRNIGAIFDTARLGYRSCLVGARLSEQTVDAAAAAINAHPGVSHNYLRSCSFSSSSLADLCRPYNLWFTVAIAPDSRLGLEATVATLARVAGAEGARVFPALKVFKIGVRLDMEGDAGAARKENGIFSSGNGASTDFLAPSECEIVRALQAELPLVEEPFREAARRCGLGVEETLGHARDLLSRGIMRRFAAVLNHKKAGYTANVMVGWSVDDDRIEEAGARMAQFRAVSHCYRRPSYPDWPLTIFTMVHEKSRERSLEAVAAISRETGIEDYALLWTVREFKKVRLQYFSPDFEVWEEKALGGLLPKAPRGPRPDRAPSESAPSAAADRFVT
jgi:siroheme decarboxylase